MEIVAWIGTFLQMFGCVLIARRNRWCWPLLNCSVLMLLPQACSTGNWSAAAVFVFFFANNCYGWWAWGRQQEQAS